MKAHVVAVAMLLSSLLALAPATAVAGWHLDFEPDTDTFRIKDVVTGRVHIRYLAAGRGSSSEGISVRCHEARFYVTGPDGTTVGMIQNSRRYYAESFPFNLSDGEEVLLPVCLAKWADRFVFEAEGEYRVIVSLTLRDMTSNASSIATSMPVTIRVAGSGIVPQAYLDALALPEICGAFRYGCRTLSVEDMRRVDLGDYTESLFAFMTYQLWHSSPMDYIRSRNRQTLQFVDIGMAVYRSRADGRRCRGEWIIERLEAMRAARRGKSFREAMFSNGELLIQWPEAL